MHDILITADPFGNFAMAPLYASASLTSPSGNPLKLLWIRSTTGHRLLLLASLTWYRGRRSPRCSSSSALEWLEICLRWCRPCSSCRLYLVCVDQTCTTPQRQSASCQKRQVSHQTIPESRKFRPTFLSDWEPPEPVHPVVY